MQKTFISAPEDIANQTRGSFIAYRRTFSISGSSRTAMLYLFADARYLVWLNGQPIHRGPNRFDIHGPEYDTVDLSNRLRVGTNTFAILVMGNGGEIQHNNDGMGFNARMMKHEPGLTLRLDVDGHPILRSDKTWKWSNRTRYRPAKIDWAKIVDNIDARVEDGDWTFPDYNDRAWKPSVKISGSAWGSLTARRIPLLRDTPVEIRYDGHAVLPVTLAAGQQLKFSTGRLVQAYTQLRIEADAGTELSLDYAGIDYMARAGRQTYISSDTCAFDGGTITVKSGRATILGFALQERLYPFDCVGKFHSSDPLLDKIWNVCARSLQVLSEDAYVDCADRERAEWMDNDPPVFDITRTAMVGPGSDGKPRYADARLLGEMLRRIALSQQAGGWVKAHTCSDRFDIHAKMEDRACDWVEGARRYYESSGDKSLIREIWPAIVGQMDYFLERRTDRGLVRAREWVVWGNPVGYVTCEGAGLNAFVYKALVDAAYLGEAIGDHRQAARFSAAAKALATAFNQWLWDESTGTYYSGYYFDDDQAKADGRARSMKLKVTNNLIEPTPFAALWALDQDIVPADRRKRVSDFLLGHRDQLRIDHIMVDYYLFKQMYAADDDALDCEVLDTLRSRWKGMAESPWQTSWETFRSGSKAHCYGMFPGYFLSAYVLGVRPQMPASDHRLLIEPHLGDLAFAEGTVITEFGPVPVSWRMVKGSLHFRVEIPSGATAVLHVPRLRDDSKLVFDGESLPSREQGRFFEVQLGAGSHEGLVKSHEEK